MPFPDSGSSYGGGAADPASVFFTITPSDTVPLPMRTRGVYVGVTGDLIAVDAYGNTAIFVAVPAGSTLAIRAVLIRSTGTTAASLIGLA